MLFYSNLSIKSTISFKAELNKCVYVFKVSSILVCPRYLATTVIFAPLLTSRDAQECLKSWILIWGTPASSQLRFFLDVIVLLATGKASPKTK